MTLSFPQPGLTSRWLFKEEISHLLGPRLHFRYVEWGRGSKGGLVSFLARILMYSFRVNELPGNRFLGVKKLWQMCSPQRQRQRLLAGRRCCSYPEIWGRGRERPARGIGVHRGLSNGALPSALPQGFGPLLQKWVALGSKREGIENAMKVQVTGVLISCRRQRGTSRAGLGVCE